MVKKKAVFFEKWNCKKKSFFFVWNNYQIYDRNAQRKKEKMHEEKWNELIFIKLTNFIALPIIDERKKYLLRSSNSFNI